MIPPGLMERGFGGCAGGVLEGIQAQRGLAAVGGPGRSNVAGEVSRPSTPPPPAADPLAQLTEVLQPCCFALYLSIYVSVCLSVYLSFFNRRGGGEKERGRRGVQRS